jgi:ribosome-associated translation inhibitor RaiA
MELSIRTRDVDLTDALRDHIARRLEFAFDTFRDHAQLVYLMDLNAPKGGADKLAQITVRVHRIGDLAVREAGTTVPVALTRAARRLSIGCRKLFGPEETLSRRSSPPFTHGSCLSRLLRRCL